MELELPEGLCNSYEDMTLLVKLCLLFSICMLCCFYDYLSSSFIGYIMGVVWGMVMLIFCNPPSFENSVYAPVFMAWSCPSSSNVALL